jgi:L-lysine exporter family protein LysE/ArgO
MVTTALAGLLTGLSLIVAIGAQNAYVLRQGLLRAHAGLVVVLCTLSDYVLIMAGTAGIGTVVRHADWALLAVRWLGAAFLAWYGLSSAWRARRPAALDASAAAGAGGSRATVAHRTLVLTWLNPHVYLDTVLLLGAIANARGPSGRWWFATGACCASTVWFTGLGLGARLLAPLLARPRSWQLLDLVIAATMLAIACELAFG